MKILILAICLILILFFLGKMQENDLEECMRAGIQSEETCRFYAYQ